MNRLRLSAIYNIADLKYVFRAPNKMLMDIINLERFAKLRFC
uniref:Uncharacterized protein n=1 Tax=Arundo donax TaxID=35708 RepID=A0A0A8Y829_ARUDO